MSLRNAPDRPGADVLIFTLRRSRKGYTLLELLIWLSVMGVLVGLLVPPHGGPCHPEWLGDERVWLAVFASGLILLMWITPFRRQWLLPTVMVTATAAFLAFDLHETNPPEPRLRKLSFQNTPLTRALQALAMQHDRGFDWRFEIRGEETARLTVTAEIYDGCSLEDAVWRIAGAAGCRCEWRWFKCTPDAPQPVAARYIFMGRRRYARRDHKIFYIYSTLVFYEESGSFYVLGP